VAEERRDQRPEAAQEDERGVYIISVVAELLGMHPQTLRIYERKGLLQPARTAGNTRRYSERDLARLRTIQRLSQDEGVNLAGVRMIVEMQNRLEELRGQMEELRLRLEDAQGRTQAEVQQVHRQYRADIVPFAEMNRLRAQVEAMLQHPPVDLAAERSDGRIAGVRHRNVDHAVVQALDLVELGELPEAIDHHRRFAGDELVVEIMLRPGDDRFRDRAALDEVDPQLQRRDDLRAVELGFVAPI